MPIKNRHRGIYLLPNLLTTAALFAGFYAIMAASLENFSAAATALFVAAILDGLDGRIARLVGSESEFGRHYDSLSDMVCFGVAPAFMALEWSLWGIAEDSVWSRLPWLSAFLYVACAALRLARFNLSAEISGKQHFFRGLPSPAAAMLLVGMLWTLDNISAPLDGQTMAILAIVNCVVSALLMISQLPFYSFKGLSFNRNIPFLSIFWMALFFALLAIDPPRVIWGIALLYAASGMLLPVFWYGRQWFRNNKDMI